MWVFLATEVMFFGALFLAVGVYRFLYAEAFEKASERLNWMIGGVNTLVLLLSSLMIVLAVHYAQHDNRVKTVLFLGLTALLGVCFLCFKGLEYYIDYQEMLIPGWRFDASEWVTRDGLKPDQIPHVKLFLFLYWVMTGLARGACHDRYRRCAGHDGDGLVGAILRRLLRARRRDRALLALCRYRLDLLAADAVPVGHTPLVTESRMSDRLLTPATYLIILAVLMVLTILTVGLSFVSTSGLVRIVAGQAIAVVKASLVVLFFMHALRSAAQTRAVIAVSIFWFVVVFLALTFSDYLTRGLIPNLPGH